MGAEHIEVRPADGAERAAFVATFEAAWGSASGAEQRRQTGLDVAGERPLAAFAGGQMAGTAMSFSLELTVPGRVQLPMAGNSS